MEWLEGLFFSNSIANSVLILGLTVSLGLMLGRIKFGSVSLGVTWVLFVGILLSHLGLGIDPRICNFIKEFGLILFVYSIGLQVGPGFFSSFKEGGVRLNLLAMLIVAGGFGIIKDLVGYTAMFAGLGALIVGCGIVGIFILRDADTLEKSGGMKDILYGFRPSVVRANPALYLTLLIILIYSVATQIFMPYMIIYMNKYLQ